MVVSAGAMSVEIVLKIRRCAVVLLFKEITEKFLPQVKTKRKFPFIGLLINN